MKRLASAIITSACLCLALPTFAFRPPPTLRNEAGQMMMVGFKGTKINANSPIVQAIKNYHIGGVIIFQHENLNGKAVTRNITSPKQLKKLTDALQFYAKKYGDKPLFISTNQEGGLINNLKPAQGFKLEGNSSEQTLGEENNQRMVYQEAYNRGVLLKTYSINLNLAPVAGLNTNPNNPAIGKLQRSFGANPKKVTADLATTIAAYRTAGILSCLKHYPGLGSATSNTDFAMADVTKTWTPAALYSYRTLIKRKKASRFVMVTHLINRQLDPSGLPASLSQKMVTGVLRNQLHFRGIILTDDMDAAAIRKHYKMTRAIKLAVMAGDDILLYGGTFGYPPSKDAQQLFETLTAFGKSNPKARAKMMNAYERISELKRMYFNPSKDIRAAHHRTTL